MWTEPTAAYDYSSVTGKAPINEPTFRISRYPLRLFRDTQIAVAEVFGENVLRHSTAAGGRPQNPTDSKRLHSTHCFTPLTHRWMAWRLTVVSYATCVYISVEASKRSSE